MGITKKLKRLHKQTLMRLKDIKRVVIADEAGVNNAEYLGRARTLKSYTDPEPVPRTEQTSSVAESKKTQNVQSKMSAKKSSKFKM